jgi:acyl-CoA thioester hydrolase
MSTAASLPEWFRCRRLVEFRDTDAAGIAHFSAFFFWMESAEHAFLRHLGLHVVDHAPEDADDLLAELAPVGANKPHEPLEVSWPRVSVSADYRAAVRFGEEVEVAVGVVEVGASSVTYAFRFERQGLLVATGKVVAVRCLMRRGQKPLPVQIPPGVVSRLRNHLVPAAAAEAS